MQLMNLQYNIIIYYVSIDKTLNQEIFFLLDYELDYKYELLK